MNKQEYMRLMIMLAPAIASLCKTKGNPNDGIVDNDNGETEVPNDLYVYYDFVARLFDDILDKIAIKGEEYVGKGNVLDAVYDAAARCVGRMPTRDELFRTIITMKDKNNIAILRNGVYCKDVEDKLIDCIVYDLMALYALKDNEVYDYYDYLEGEYTYGSPKRPAKSRNG